MQQSHALLLVLGALLYYVLFKDKVAEHFRGIGQCSKDCCGNQWPTGIASEPGAVKPGKDLPSSNITCNSRNHGAGCVCLSPGGLSALRRDRS